MEEAPSPFRDGMSEFDPSVTSMTRLADPAATGEVMVKSAFSFFFSFFICLSEGSNSVWKAPVELFGDALVYVDLPTEVFGVSSLEMSDSSLVFEVF